MIMFFASCFQTIASLDTGNVDTSNAEESQDSADSTSDSGELWEDTGEWPAADWVVIGSGNWHTCAVAQDQTTTCWGRNLEGQASPPSDIPFRMIAGGWFFTCGLAFDSTVHCWGEFDFEVLAQRYTYITAGKDFLCGIVGVDQSIECTGFPDSPPVGTFVQMDAGVAHVCALDTFGQVFCFGDNSHGQCNTPSTTFHKVQSGFRHSCAVNDDGLQCWGGEQDGSTDVPLVQGNNVWTGNFHNCTLNANHLP